MNRARLTPTAETALPPWKSVPDAGKNEQGFQTQHMGGNILAARKPRIISTALGTRSRSPRQCGPSPPAVGSKGLDAFSPSM